MSADTTIAQLDSSHAEAIFNLFSTIVYEAFPTWTDASKLHWLKVDYPLSYWQKQLDEQKLPIFGAFDETGSLIGFSAMEGLNYGVAYLGWIGVLEKHQGQGLGDALMQTTIDWCKAQPTIHKIELETQYPELAHYYQNMVLSLKV